MSSLEGLRAGLGKRLAEEVAAAQETAARRAELTVDRPRNSHSHSRTRPHPLSPFSCFACVFAFVCLRSSLQIQCSGYGSMVGDTAPPGDLREPLLAFFPTVDALEIFSFLRSVGGARVRSAVR